MRRFFALAVIAGAVAGCAAIDREAGIQEVQSLAAERAAHAVELRATQTRVAELLTGDLTPASAVQVALLNNPALRATLLELRMSHAEVVQAGLLKNPVFDAVLRIPFSGGGTGVELTIVQDLLDAVWIPLRTQKAAAEFEAAKLRVTGAILELIARAKMAFVRVQAAGEVLAFRKDAAEAAAIGLEFARRIHAAGNMTDLQLAGHEAHAAHEKLRLAEAENELAMAREKLAAVMGIGREQLDFKISAALAPPAGEPPGAETLESAAVEKSLELAAARFVIAADKAGIQLAKPMGFFPEFVIGPTAEKDPGEGWTLGPAVSMELPLFDQGQAKVALLEARHERIRAMYAAMELAIRSDVRATRVRLLGARTRALLYQESLLPARAKITEQTQVENLAMLTGIFELLEAKREQLESQIAHVTVLRDYWLASVQLETLAAGRRSAGGASNPVVEHEGESR